MSVGDDAITRRMVEVAVCCSSASCTSLNSRTLPIAITAWSAKVWTSSISRVENGPGSRRATEKTPTT